MARSRRIDAACFMSLPPHFGHQSLLFGLSILRQCVVAWRQGASTINHARRVHAEASPASEFSKVRCILASEAATTVVDILLGTLVLVVSYTFIPSLAIALFRHFEDLAKSDENNYRLQIPRYGER